MNCFDKKNICNNTDDINTIISLTKDSNPQVRVTALKSMCPCHVKADIDLFWDRIIEMVNDEDDNVRYQVLHTLCDGSPSHRENNVMDAIEIFNRDKNKDIKRRAHKVLASYRKTGRWNIL